ncbi:Pc12g01630 [Penicillium rubens Wisconsin 54-1255]|uniref:Pc12g01630 protein n=1 Tax=Penicillium rubens (strain ATCC 28089 / DSM 1075 / NRRL 1951 / Wisconsin 54-1255) TaxID=500485 RepID=B6GZ36_PENRW|nr:Pc12g01630 [Penicillium rubens Wisconsin 54-1255]
MIQSEILVHIAAPSTAQDDARYRAQVAAILEFQCASRQPLMESKSSAPDPDHAHPFSSAAHSSVPSTTQHEASPILREAPRPAYATLSSDRRLLPEREGATPRQPINSNHPDSLESLISVIPDSQPEIAEELVQPRAELSSPSQLAPPPKRPRTSPATPNPAQPVSIIDSPAADQPAAAHKVIPAENQDHRLPTGYIPHPTTSHHIPATIPNPINLSTLPLEIHPPKPPISTAPYTTHITPTLSMLAERLNPARTYKPSSQTRPLDPLERGYWLVHLAIENQIQNQDQNTRTWPYPLFHAFWSFLSDFVGRDGRAGWGVWCILEAAPSTLSHTHVSLKVYTWGEVAMHVYLLLYLASERRVRGMGVQWRDAREEVVIQMP